MAAKFPSFPSVERRTFVGHILQNYVTLTNQLQVKAVIPYLIQEGVLKIDHKEEILACANSQDMAQALLDKVVTHGNCTLRLFVDILRRSGQGNLADMLEGGPSSKVARTEGIGDMTDSQLEELGSRLRKFYREEAERHEGNKRLEGLIGYEIGDAKPRILPEGTATGVRIVSLEQWLSVRPSLVVKEEPGHQVGTALAADWVGDKKFTTNFKQLYKLQLDKVQKDGTIIDAISTQLLHDPNYSHKRFFSKKSLWNYMKQTQEEILFVLEGLDRLSPFTSMEFLQLIDKNLLPRATVIVTYSAVDPKH